MATAPLSNLTATWNASGTTFTAIKMNATDTASAAGSLLMDLQVGGSSKFAVNKTGVATINNRTTYAANGVAAALSIFNAAVDPNKLTISGGTNGIQFNDAANTVGLMNLSNAGALTLGGVAVPTISSSDTLSNKTLSSPTLSGTVTVGTSTFSGTPTFNNKVRIQNGTDVILLELVDGSVGTTVRQTPVEVGGVRKFRTTFSADGSSFVDVFEVTSGGVEIVDGRNIILNTTNGTKIGTATSQKLGFFNATPVVQPTAVADATGAGDVVTQLNALLTRMRNLGLIAT
jgi:hypothetical protein